jgi:hypothetical protein
VVDDSGDHPEGVFAKVGIVGNDGAFWQVAPGEDPIGDVELRVALALDTDGEEDPGAIAFRLRQQGIDQAEVVDSVGGFDLGPLHRDANMSGAEAFDKATEGGGAPRRSVGAILVDVTGAPEGGVFEEKVLSLATTEVEAELRVAERFDVGPAEADEEEVEKAEHAPGNERAGPEDDECRSNAPARETGTRSDRGLTLI